MKIWTCECGGWNDVLSGRSGEGNAIPGSKTKSPVPQKRTEGSLVEELPHLLAERGLSVRRLALMTGIDQSHLSRMLRGDPRRPPTAAVAERVSNALGLSPDYFPEVREAFVIQRIQHDPALRESLYRRLKTPTD